MTEVSNRPSIRRKKKKLNYFLSGHQQLNWRWERHPIIYNWRVSRGRMDRRGWNCCLLLHLVPKVAILWDSCQHFPTDWMLYRYTIQYLLLSFLSILPIKISLIQPNLTNWRVALTDGQTLMELMPAVSPCAESGHSLGLLPTFSYWLNVI